MSFVASNPVEVTAPKIQQLRPAFLMNDHHQPEFLASRTASALNGLPPLVFFDAEDEVWDRHWQVNVMSAVRLSRAYLPGMQKLNWGVRAGRWRRYRYTLRRRP